MDEKTNIRCVELVRSIRDAQARQLSGKSNAEIIEFFRQAGKRARQYAQQHTRQVVKTDST